MKLFLLQRIGQTDYDEYAGFVIRTTSPQKARKLAAVSTGSRIDAQTWLDLTKSRCSRLRDDGPEGNVIEDYRAG